MTHFSAPVNGHVSRTQLRIRGHFGSRAIPVQVNIVALSDHVFHRFPSDLFIQVSATKISLFLSIAFDLMAIDRACEDAMHTSLPGLPPLSSNVGSPNGSGHDLDGMGTRSGGTMDEQLDAPSLKIVHFETQIAQILALTGMDIPYGFTFHENTWGILRPDSQRWNIISAASLHVCASSRLMLPRHQMFPVRQHPGLS